MPTMTGVATPNATATIPNVRRGTNLLAQTPASDYLFNVYENSELLK